jgi:four helix bundle protein
MLEEARAAESRRDFISKCSIALKECRECHVRLIVLETCAIGAPAQVRLLRQEAHELASIIGAIVRNTRRNAGLSPGARRTPRRPPAQ